MTCDNCGGADFQEIVHTGVFRAEEKLTVVEGIPATECKRCGDVTFEADVAERLRELVHGPHQAAKPIPAELLRYKAA